MYKREEDRVTKRVSHVPLASVDTYHAKADLNGLMSRSQKLLELRLRSPRLLFVLWRRFLEGHLSQKKERRRRHFCSSITISGSVDVLESSHLR